jgi:excisionase family DNA binding protein
MKTQDIGPSSDNDGKEIVTTGFAARLLNRSENTVRAYERAGRLPAVRVAGGMRLFRRSDIDRLAEQLAG